ncbi:MAG: hypothetical protein ACKN9K_30640, partial [Dolichospermum sp.]
AKQSNLALSRSNTFSVRVGNYPRDSAMIRLVSENQQIHENRKGKNCYVDKDLHCLTSAQISEGILYPRNRSKTSSISQIRKENQ